jgi:hypothetical protein
MVTLKNRVEQIEKEQQFRIWVGFERFLESLTAEQLQELALHSRFPEPLPEPLPKGTSRLDGLNRKTLRKLWEESERKIARIVHQMKGRSRDEHRFYLDHEHWPEQACGGAGNCRKRRCEPA